MQTVGFCEIEPFCRAVLKKHWPDVPIFEDVRNVTGELIREHCGRIDLICAGVPCQPASVAGKRKGASDDRWMWPQLLRLVSEVKPVFLLAENPRGVTSLRVEGLQFSQWIAGEFAARGYELFPVELAAEDVGAPHRRERIFFVAYRASTRRWALAGCVSGNARQPVHRQNCDNQPPSCGQRSNVANAGSSERRPPAEGRLNDDDRADTGWQETASGFEFCSDELANANRLRQRQPSRSVAEGGQWTDDGSEGLADTKCGRLETVRQYRELGETASGESDARNQLAGTSFGCGSQWPARPGQPQYEWEEPRTIEQSVTGFSIQILDADSGDWRSTAHLGGAAKKFLKSGLGESTSGVSGGLVRNRVAALKALGNAVVPQVAEVVGRAILEMEVA